MKTLKIPLSDKSAKDIFEECARDFIQKTEYMEVALSYVNQVEICSHEYLKYVPKNIASLTTPKIDSKERKIIEKVYSQKFSPENSIGRKYYDIIMGNAKGRCPICGCGKAKNLDHFLPKSTYPLLCVTPVNLIPTCRDCNMEKKNYSSTNYYEIPFHPYLDQMDDRWVECELHFYNDSTFLVKYKNGYNQDLDHDKWKKYDIHMKLNDLCNTFNCRAEEEIENTKEYYKKELLTCGKDNVTSSLKEVVKSAETIDVNSWKSALYRVLVKNIDAFCRWLSC